MRIVVSKPIGMLPGIDHAGLPECSTAVVGVATPLQEQATDRADEPPMKIATGKERALDAHRRVDAVHRERL